MRQSSLWVAVSFSFTIRLVCVYLMNALCLIYALRLDCVQDCVRDSVYWQQRLDGFTALLFFVCHALPCVSRHMHRKQPDTFLLTKHRKMFIIFISVFLQCIRSIAYYYGYSFSSALFFVRKLKINKRRGVFP